MTIWLSSDIHLGHENIIRYCGRPFANADEMNEALIERHNAIVRPSDHWYHLGDVAMRKDFLHIVQRFNGHRRLLLGNHDIYPVQDYLKAGFEKIMAWRMMDNHVLTHVPIHPLSMGRFAGNIHGHIHDSPSFGSQYLNVSVEAINYTPITFEDAKARLQAQKEA
jgi:calcineurin-like phosphoesterase family protein